MTSIAVDLDRTLHDMVVGMRVLHHAGLDSGVAGHVSCRVPGEAAYWINPWGVYWDELRPEHLVKMTFGLERVGGDDRAPSQGSGFHAAIYRRREDVNVICHTHAPHLIAFSTTRQVLGMYDQRAPIFLGRMATFEQRSYRQDAANEFFGGDDNDGIAEALGRGSVVFLNHHGALNVGPDVATTLIEHLYLEECVRTQLWAMTLGGVPMDDAIAHELAADDAMRATRSRLAADWDASVRRLRRLQPDVFADR